MSSSSRNNPPIFVTKSFPPPLEEYHSQLQDIWNNRIFTNSGPKHAELKAQLKKFLNVPDCVLMANGTLALMAAIAGLELSDGEVITTPFTFVASGHCLEPFNLIPRFVDIKPDDLTIDPVEVEKAITTKTKAILAVHVYGNPCDVDVLQKIADKHNLKIIYDAAHAFGVNYNGQSVLNYGDASCLSFHATKAFHTFEGGAVVSHHADVCEYMRRYRNFGIRPPEGTVIHHGINTKMSELHAAAGLVNLPHYQAWTDRRRKLYERYKGELSQIEGLRFVSFDLQENANYNYCPVLFEKGRDELFDKMAEQGIFTRKYFYPLLTDMPAYAEHKQEFKIASKVADNILCLPIYHDLSEADQDRVINIIKNFRSA